MALKVQVVDGRSFSKTVFLEGKLNNDTVAILDHALHGIASNDKTTVIVFDLADLEYISSAGLRSIFSVQRIMAARGGRALLLSPRPHVKKVFEIANATDLFAVYSTVEELDRYLDKLQQQIIDGA